MRHKKRKIAALIILATVCISGVELAACRYFAPELYQQITAPVRRGVEELGALCTHTLTQISNLAKEVEEAVVPDEPPVSQLAGDPTIHIDLSQSDFSLTELVDRDGHAILTGGVFDLHYFNQGDPLWASKPYGSDQIGGYGCGPTAMAMAVSSMTGVDTDPARMAAWAVEHGYWARKSGSHYSIVNGTAAAFGLKSEALSECTPEAMQEALLSGKLLVALMGPGHFTNGGHFILIHAVTLTGQVLVADPNSTERSLIPWDPQIIIDELSTTRSQGAPLWALSYPETS